MKKDQDAPRPARVSKKPYRTPVLVVYGNISAFTQAVGPMGAADGSMTAGMMMTR